MKTIEKYFTRLTDRQKEQFQTLLRLYPEWNEKINVISRKDIDNLEVNHILHSMSIAKFIDFAPGSEVMDLGCGGGLPGLPLAILFPDTQFHLIDRTGKKIFVASEIAKEAGLQNVTFQHGDAAECKQKFDFVVSRAVMPLPDLVKLARRSISKQQRNGYPNGLITLKGGNLDSEIAKVKDPTLIENLKTWFPDEEFFKTKHLTYTQL